MPISSDSLLLFLAVAENGTFTAAAQRLGMTQPALTQRIRRLENQLGVHLLERHPKGVTTTSFGKALLTYASEVRTSIKQADAEILAMRGGRTGSVRVGAGPAWAGTILPRAIERIHRRRPGLRIEVITGVDTQLKAGLRRGEYDFIVLGLPQDLTEDPDLYSEIWFVDHFKVTARKDHPLVCAHRDVRLAELLDYPWVLPNATSLARRNLESLFQTKGLRAPVPLVESDSLSLRLSLPAFGDYLSFHAVQNLFEISSRGLVTLDIPDAVWRRAAGLMRRRVAHVTLAEKYLIEELREICKELTLDKVNDY